MLVSLMRSVTSVMAQNGLLCADAPLHFFSNSIIVDERNLLNKGASESRNVSTFKKEYMNKSSSTI